MISHPFKRLVLLIICYGVLSSPLRTFAGTSNEIRKWRDHNGVLNITNIRSGQSTTLIPIRSPTVKPTVTTLSSPVTQVAPITKHANIYTYIDSLGVKCFTNLFNNSHSSYNLALPTTRSSLNARRSAYDSIVAEAARTYQVDQALVQAVIHAESAFYPLAVSPKGATGLMQLMPDTANRYGVHDAFNPSENIHGGVRYLRDLLKMFDNNLMFAIAAYNAGENAVTRYGGIPPYAETTNYVQRVLSLHNRYQNQNNTINN